MIKKEKLWLYPLCLFILLFIQGATLGISDDEAYYWALAQDPRWGFAYHPPGVLWLISAFDWLNVCLAGKPNPAITRLPAFLSMSAILALAMRWWLLAGVPTARVRVATFTFISFIGLFGLGWMIVPDTGLFLGFALLYTAIWSPCQQKELGWIEKFGIFLGTILVIISKFSGIALVASAIGCLILWSHGKARRDALLCLLAGAFLGIIPLLIWANQNGLDSWIYQFSERHSSDGFLGLRWVKFIGSQLLMAGPGVAWMAVNVFVRRKLTYETVWALPGIVFLIQPFFAPFKPHWALVFWFPFALEFARKAGEGKISSCMLKTQAAVAIPLILAIVLFTHFPIQGWLMREFTDQEPDPLYDISNDLYGWQGLSVLLNSSTKDSTHHLPIVASRYQVVGQAAYALGDSKRVTELPLHPLEIGDWRDLGVSIGRGPGWPKLIQPIIYVADFRYKAGPSFEGGVCSKIGRHESLRYGLRSRSIDAWICKPVPLPN